MTERVNAVILHKRTGFLKNSCNIEIILVGENQQLEVEKAAKPYKYWV
jgi:hypothetical protein